MSKKKFVGVQFLEVVREGKTTIAFGIYGDHKVGRVPFAGISQKNPEDNENKNRGRNFAIGRAYENLGQQIQKKEWKPLKRKPITTNGGSKLSEAEVEAYRAAGAAKRAEREAKRNGLLESKQGNEGTSKGRKRTSGTKAA